MKRALIACIILVFAAHCDAVVNRLCGTAAGSWWKPTVNTSLHWQIDGSPINTSISAQAFDVDMFETPQSVIDELHAKGKFVICYIDTTYEPYRPDASKFTAAVKGSKMDGWPGQRWVDTRSAVVRNIMQSRLNLAVNKSCDAIEWDDVDAYQNKPGFKLTAATQLNFNKFLASITHAAGLSVGLKNDVSQLAALAPFFDWALNEQCYNYNECSGYSAFTKLNKAVFGTMYDDGTGQTAPVAPATFCPSYNKNKIWAFEKHLDLDKWYINCCSLSNSCIVAPHTCS